MNIYMASMVPINLILFQNYLRILAIIYLYVFHNVSFRTDPFGKLTSWSNNSLPCIDLSWIIMLRWSLLMPMRCCLLAVSTAKHAATNIHVRECHFVFLYLLVVQSLWAVGIVRCMSRSFNVNPVGCLLRDLKIRVGTCHKLSAVICFVS